MLLVFPSEVAISLQYKSADIKRCIRKPVEHIKLTIKPRKGTFL